MSVARHWSTVLVMASEESHAETVRRHYAQWRLEKGLPDRCDKEVCMFHSQPLVWNGEVLPLILDHISGNNCDNLPTNLRYVCPNCNQQLPTTGGRNRGRISNRSGDGYLINERDGKTTAVATGKSVRANYQGILAVLEEELAFFRAAGNETAAAQYEAVLPAVRGKAEQQQAATAVADGA